MIFFRFRCAKGVDLMNPLFYQIDKKWAFQNWERKARILQCERYKKKPDNTILFITVSPENLGPPSVSLDSASFHTVIECQL
jgi:hypothetical protein